MKNQLITGIIGLLLIGIGCGFLPFEIMDFDYVDTVNPTFEKKTVVKEYAISPNQIYKIHIPTASRKIVTDDTLKNAIEIKISYPKDYFEMQSTEIPSENNYQLFYEFEKHFETEQVKNIIDVFLDDIANKKFYNYNKTFIPVIEIRVSSTNLENIKIIQEDYDEEGFDF